MKFLDCLAKATAQDLEEIQAQAAELEGQAQALRGLAVLIGKRLQNGGGQPAAAAEPSMNGHHRTPKAAQPTGPGRRPRIPVEQTRDAIAKLLLKGPAKAVAIERAVGVGGGSLYKALKTNWFKKGDGGAWDLTSAGRELAKAALN